jgi:hypothetical protein
MATRTITYRNAEIERPCANFGYLYAGGMPKSMPKLARLGVTRGSPQGLESMTCGVR